MCQDTLGCIKLLSALPWSCDTVCISNITRQEESVRASVRLCVCRCVPPHSKLFNSTCCCVVMCGWVWMLSPHHLLSGCVSFGIKYTHCTGQKRHGNALTLLACLFLTEFICVRWACVCVCASLVCLSIEVYLQHVCGCMYSSEDIVFYVFGKLQICNVFFCQNSLEISSCSDSELSNFVYGHQLFHNCFQNKLQPSTAKS